MECLTCGNHETKLQFELPSYAYRKHYTDVIIQRPLMLVNFCNHVCYDTYINQNEQIKITEDHNNPTCDVCQKVFILFTDNVLHIDNGIICNNKSCEIRYRLYVYNI